MTKPLALSQVAQTVIEATTEWAYANTADAANALVALNQNDTQKVGELLEGIMHRSIRAGTAQTYLLAEKHAKAEMEVMAGNARKAVAS